MRNCVWTLLWVVFSPGTPFRPKSSPKQAQNHRSTNSCLSSRNRYFSDRIPRVHINQFEVLNDSWRSSLNGSTGCASEKPFEPTNRFENIRFGQNAHWNNSLLLSRLVILTQNRDSFVRWDIRDHLTESCKNWFLWGEMYERGVKNPKMNFPHPQNLKFQFPLLRQAQIVYF